jgi:ribosomal protein L21E
MNSPVTLQATWIKQCLFTIVSQYGNPTGQGWYNAGNVVSASVESPYPISNGTRYITTNYVGQGSAPQTGTGTDASFTINSPSVVTFVWQPQYLIQVLSHYSAASGTGWYDAGSTASITLQDSVVSIQNGTRAVFSGWTSTLGGSKSASYAITVNKPGNLTAGWTIQYYLTVHTQYSNATGEGWYNAGSPVSVSIEKTSISENLFTSKVFKGWTGTVNATTQNLTITMTGPSQVAATWANDYSRLYLIVGVGSVVIVAMVAAVMLFMFRNRRVEELPLTKLG